MATGFKSVGKIINSEITSKLLKFNYKSTYSQPNNESFLYCYTFYCYHFSLNGQTKMQLINSNDGHKNIYEILSSYIQIKSESGNEKEAGLFLRNL